MVYSDKENLGNSKMAMAIALNSVVCLRYISYHYIEQ